MTHTNSPACIIAVHRLFEFLTVVAVNTRITVLAVNVTVVTVNITVFLKCEFMWHGR